MTATIHCDHEAPCLRYACADTNGLERRSLDDVEYLAQQGRISEAKVEEYLTLWNDCGGHGRASVAEWRDGAIRVRERTS